LGHIVEGQLLQARVNHYSVEALTPIREGDEQYFMVFFATIIYVQQIIIVYIRQLKAIVSCTNIPGHFGPLTSECRRHPKFISVNERVVVEN